MTRRVFYSFHYEADVWRVSKVRNIGMIEDNAPANDNDWETIVRGGDAQIKRWIDQQMSNRTCIVVLVGTNTAHRPWVRYEIVEAWNRGLGVVGICINGITDQHGLTSFQGSNPFSSITINGRAPLSSIAKWYDPPGYDSAQRYNWIRNHLSAMVEEAIQIRKNYR